MVRPHLQKSWGWGAAGAGRHESFDSNDNHVSWTNGNGSPFSHKDPGNCSRKLASSPDEVKLNVSERRMKWKWALEPHVTSDIPDHGPR